MRSSWSQLLLAGLAVIFAAAAGSLLSSGTTTVSFVVGLTLAIGAAMVCGAAAALQVFRAQQAASPIDTADLTIDLAEGVPAGTSRRFSLASVKPLGAFVAATSATVALAVILIGWSDGPSRAEPLPMTMPVAALVVPQATPAASPLQKVALVSAPAVVKAATVERNVDGSLARRECLAQIESAHLFLGMAREAKGVGAYTRMSNTQIKRYQAARPVDALTLQRIALRMWDQRNAPDRDGRWWSSQYASCEQARVAGAGYVVRG